MLPCPECAGESKVRDSRYAADVVRRRRECLRCKHRWSTYETNIDPRELLLEGRRIRDAFDRQSRATSAFSITVREQKKLDARAARYDRGQRNAKIVSLAETISPTVIAQRLGETPDLVRRIARRAK